MLDIFRDGFVPTVRGIIGTGPSYEQCAVGRKVAWCEGGICRGMPIESEIRMEGGKRSWRRGERERVDGAIGTVRAVLAFVNGGLPDMCGRSPTAPKDLLSAQVVRSDDLIERPVLFDDPFLLEPRRQEVADRKGGRAGFCVKWCHKSAMYASAVLRSVPGEKKGGLSCGSADE